jgi:hypothetical protein
MSERMVTIAAYVALAVVGAMVGIVESFSYPWTWGTFPIASILISALNFGLLWLAGWGMGGKLGAVVPAGMWLVALMVFSVRTPSGGLIVTGDTPGNVYLLGGTVAGLAAIVVTRSSGSWLLGGAGSRRE